MFDADRAVEVISRGAAARVPDGYQSGYYLGGGLVLTCAHGLSEAAGVDLTVRDLKGRRVGATIVWCNRRDDVALLSVDVYGHLPRETVRLGKLPHITRDVKVEFVMYGWPRAGRDGPKRNPVQANGSIKLAEVAGAEPGTVRLRPGEGHLPPGSWMGMSGAVAVCGGYLIAVQIMQPDPKLSYLGGRLLTEEVLTHPDECGRRGSEVLDRAGIEWNVTVTGLDQPGIATVVTVAGLDQPGIATVVTALLILAAAIWALDNVSNHPWIGPVAAVIIAVAALFRREYLRTVQQTVWRIIQFLVGNWRWVVPVAGLEVLVLVGTLVLPWLWPPGGRAFAGGCPHPMELRVLTSIDGLEPTRALARRYERWNADRNQDHPGCPTVHAFVYAPATSAAATSALAKGWRDDARQHPLVSVGPRPDVWLPDSTVDVREVEDLASRAHLPPPIRGSSSIGSSPVVLAIQEPLGDVAAARTWPELFSKFSGEPGSALLAPDPKTSSVGLLAAAGYLSDGNGNLVPIQDARQRVRAVVVAGADAEGSAALLCQRSGAAATTAPRAIISKQVWQWFVTGVPQVVHCPGGPVSPGSPPVVPDGTPVMDHPYVKFNWSTPAQQALVDEFHQWLSGTSGRDALKAAGLEPARPDCIVLHNTACVPSDLKKTLDLYLEAQEPGQVLFALDASGSMDEQVGRDLIRFELASRAVSSALGHMGPNDQFGLWTFSGEGGPPGRQQLVDIAEGDERHRENTINALSDVRPAGDTPLYDTVIAGMQAIAVSAKDVGPRALVVLTDGHDTSSAMSAEAARQQVGSLAAAGVRLFVIATGQASCTGTQGLRDLATVGLGGCFDANPDQLDETVAQLFKSLWKGQ